jgi:serine O-acetyltransferase
MKLKECFTLDLYIRNGNKISFFEIIRRLIFNSSYRVVVYYRLAVWFAELKFMRRVARLISLLILTRLTRVPGVEIGSKKIGAGFLIAHPHDIVIGNGVVIGEKVTIYNGVTCGAKTLVGLDDIKDRNSRYPTIEDGVTIFTGAKVIGAITIGKGSIIGANSVVMKSCPPYSIVAGVPGKLIGENTECDK